ncbi:hypothetical protein [Allorhodopirellula solitaria]|uniref:Uncharacterized protein n=1 Tax=Allorhodopirellula solitaria TaxID=2527987 RepID=A0A5C5XSX2_9BACT|nr:hypothetical protein [Allorhodopirellula solitaria]TWT66000.1 hypothetical protein CA85_28590 [Allorhodopirellula solitaria]
MNRQTRSAARLFFGIACCVLFAAGCTNESTSTKLETPEGIDWEAIEAQGASIADESAKGERAKSK